MNQILMTETKKKKQRSAGSSGPLDIKSIVRFFAIAILVFGIFLAGQGSYALYKAADDKKPSNMPSVTLSRYNDTAILYVDHSVEISKVIYSWDNGEETVLPQGSTRVQEEILLPQQNSTLNIIIEDMNGKRVSYQKLYNIEGMDITKPTIDVDAEDGKTKMTITARDDTEISYLSYQWEDEQPVVIKANTPGQTEIVQEVELVPGTKKIHIIAEDVNGNVEQIDKEIVATTAEPKMQIVQNGKEIILEVSDEDGIKDIYVTLNGKKAAAKDLNVKDIKVGPLYLQEGTNSILVEVLNVSGYTKKASREIQYTP